MRLIWSVIVALADAATVFAEDKLTKNGADYIGRKKSKETFTTCHGGDILIEPGGVVGPTAEKCDRPILSPLSGTVAKVTSSTLAVKDSHGTEITFNLKS